MVSIEIVNGIATTPKLLLSSASTMVGTVSTGNDNRDIACTMLLSIAFEMMLDDIISIEL